MCRVAAVDDREGRVVEAAESPAVAVLFDVAVVLTVVGRDHLADQN